MKYQEMKIPVSLQGSAYLAVLTDRVICGIWQRDLQFECQEGPADLGENLLELRVFNAEEEFRAWRQYKGEEFRTRYINDRDNSLPFFDEVHVLDQNENLTEEKENGYVRFVTTGGGTYILPGDRTVCRVKVRTYLRGTDESNGIEIPYDWRIVAFGGKELQKKEAV